MQIEQLASMSTEPKPQTTTTVFDVAAATPRIWNFRSWARSKWRSKGALVLYAVMGVSLLGGKWYFSAPRRAAAAAAAMAAATSSPATASTATRDGDETRKLMAKLQANKAKTDTAAAKAALEKPAQRMASTASPANTTNSNATAPVARVSGGGSASATATAGTATAATSAAGGIVSTPTMAVANGDVPTKSAPAAAPAAAPTTAPSASAKPKAVDPLGALYIDETNGYSVRFPAGWTIHSFDSDPWVCDVGDGKVALISIGFSPFPDNITAENIPPDWIAKKIKRRADTTLHSQGYAMISGRKALWSKSTGPLPMTHATPRMTRVNYILPLGDGRVLELRVAAAPEVFDRLVPVMRKSVETFALQTPRKKDREPVASAR